MTKYAIVFHGRVLQIFEAKSERSAKIRTSKFCSASSELYKQLCGIRLCDENGNEIAAYSPYFAQWFDYRTVTA